MIFNWEKIEAEYYKRFCWDHDRHTLEECPNRLVLNFFREILKQEKAKWEAEHEKI